MPVITKIDSKKIAQFIFARPVEVKELLELYGYSLSKKVTVQELSAKTLTAIYQSPSFDKAFTQLYIKDGFNDFATIAVAGALSIASAIFGSSQARKQRELMKNIALAKMEQERLLTLEQIRVYGETERTRILANSLTEYRSTVQQEATKREQNVYVYLIAIGLSISLIYGTTRLLKDV